MKNIVIAILFAFNIALAAICYQWSVAYEGLYSDYAEATNPSSRRADIYVMTNGDVWALFDGRWVYKFEGACRGMKEERSL